MFTNTYRYPLSRWHARGLGILLVIALLFTLLPTRALAAPQAKLDCDSSYEVKRGDTLTKIGNRFAYDTNQIAYANDWDRPYTIYVGQRICIPTETKSGLSKLASKYANARAVFFSAGRTKGDILIYTYNYPKTTVQVKVDNAGDSARKFETIGTINISRVGNGKAWRFKLPADLKDASKLTICLKDRTTSYLQCVTPRSGS